MTKESITDIINIYSSHNYDPSALTHAELTIFIDNIDEMIDALSKVRTKLMDEKYQRSIDLAHMM